MPEQSTQSESSSPIGIRERWMDFWGAIRGNYYFWVILTFVEGGSTMIEWIRNGPAWHVFLVFILLAVGFGALFASPSSGSAKLV
jgi:hypothetical protein